MIRYSLACDKGHEFEGWFGSSDDFDVQKKRGFVTCPNCNSATVEKRLMAPNVKTSRNRAQPPVAGQPAQTDAVPAAPAVAGGQALQAVADPEQQAAIEQLREVKRKLMADAEDVGQHFSEEARKIHYGETEARGIYGQASLEEAAKLLEEGIDFLPLPDLPEEKN